MTSFWTDAATWRAAAAPRVFVNVVVFGLIAVGACEVDRFTQHRFGQSIELDVGYYEVAGAVLGGLLVLRTNAGYDRWWEARRLWGGIVNQCRNFATAARYYGPDDADWRRRTAGWTAAFPHACKRFLRGERGLPEAASLFNDPTVDPFATAPHQPLLVAAELAKLLREARDHHDLDPFAFLQADRERAQLMDHLGGCERILKTPLPASYAIKIRQFIALFLATLPLALLKKTDDNWLILGLTVLIAYSMLAIDEIGHQLQNPFDSKRLDALPLDGISETIGRDVRGLLGSGG